MCSELDRQRQLGQILAGAARALARRGYRATSVEDVLAGTGLPVAVFFEHFDDLRGCVLAAHDLAFARLTSSLDEACAGEDVAAEKLAAAVDAFVEFSWRSPEEARLLMLDVMVVDPILAARVLESHDVLARLLFERRSDLCPPATPLPDLTEAALVGAITSTIGGRLICGEVESLRALAPELVELALMPYLGPERARRVALDRSAPTA